MYEEFENNKDLSFDMMIGTVSDEVRYLIDLLSAIFQLKPELKSDDAVDFYKKVLPIGFEKEIKLKNITTREKRNIDKFLELRGVNIIAENRVWDITENFGFQ